MQDETVSNAPIRVALIYLGRRGAGGWIGFELASQLQRIFTLLTITSEYLEQRSAWKSLRIAQIVTPTFRNALSALLSLLVPMQVNMLVRKIRQHEPEVLLFPMFHPWNALIQKRMPDVPSVVFVHDPRPHPDLTGWLFASLEQASIRQATRCIIMSANLVDELHKRGIPLERIDTLPLGSFRVTLNRNLTLEKKRDPTLLFFGRIAPYKGLDILLQAYAEIRRTHSARLVIAGEGNLKPFRRLLDKSPDVELINRWIPEDEIENIFSKSDLLVLPYTSASQSGVIPIAASLGLPVIATQTGGIPEQIEDGVNGWLVQPGNRDSLSMAIREVLDHPDVARQRGEALRRRYESLLNWEAIALQVAESLKKAVQARGQG